MKKLILGALLLLSTLSFGQTDTIKSKSISFDEVKSIKEKSEMKLINKNGISQYVASNNITIKVGDKFRLSRPEGGSKTFISITNKPTVMDAMGGNFNPTVSTSMSNTEIEIKTLYIYGTPKLGFKTWAILKTCGTCNDLLVDIELAIETKEIRLSGMTKEDAILKLKESKELLDLGMIKQEEFDKLKTELAPIILK